MNRNKLVGTLPASISAWTSIEFFDVSDNKNLAGTIPLGIGSSWKKLKMFVVWINQLQNGSLPELPFENMPATASTGCYLIDHFDGGHNSFNCPWPAKATSYCMKNSPSGSYVKISDSDCSSSSMS